MAPSHYLNQCWTFGNCTRKNKLQWNLERHPFVFIQENAFENVVCEMASILFRSQCVKAVFSYIFEFIYHVDFVAFATLFLCRASLSTADELEKKYAPTNGLPYVPHRVLTPVASFTKEVYPRLAKCPLNINGRLANRGSTTFVKVATSVFHSDLYGVTLPPLFIGSDFIQIITPHLKLAWGMVPKRSALHKTTLWNRVESWTDVWHCRQFYEV